MPWTKKLKREDPQLTNAKNYFQGCCLCIKSMLMFLHQVTELKVRHNSRQKLILIAHFYRGAVSVAKTQLNFQLINHFTCDTDVLIRHSQVWFTIVTTDPREKVFRKKLIKDRMWVLKKYAKLDLFSPLKLLILTVYEQKHCPFWMFFIFQRCSSYHLLLSLPGVHFTQKWDMYHHVDKNKCLRGQCTVLKTGKHHI